MKKLISCCGLNCATCDAYIATVKDDNDLRKSTSEKWQKIYDAPFISPDEINCLGCREEGIKFSHCSVCEIRNCVAGKGFDTCADCTEMDKCEIVAMVHKYTPEAVKNLKSLN